MTATDGHRNVASFVGMWAFSRGLTGKAAKAKVPHAARPLPLLCWLRSPALEPRSQPDHEGQQQADNADHGGDQEEVLAVSLAAIQ